MAEPKPTKVWSKGCFSFQLFQPGLDSHETTVRIRKHDKPYQLVLGNAEFCRIMVKAALTQLST